MAQNFSWGNGHVTLVFSVDDIGEVCVERVIAKNGVAVVFPRRLPLVEILIAGTGHWIADDRLIHTSVGRELRYVSHTESYDKCSGLRRLSVLLTHSSLRLCVEVVFTMPNSVAMTRVSVTVTNGSDQKIALESVTSLVGSFGAPEGRPTNLDGWTLTDADYDWLGEGRWHTRPVRELLPKLNQQMTGHDPRSEYQVVSTGTWSTGKHSTLAVLENSDFGLVWIFQVEHNGAWRWEVGDNTTDGYFAVSGPTNVNHAWTKILDAGESFETVPASVALGISFKDAISQVTAYRRTMRVQHEDNTLVRIVFNDYMNTINGDPTTEKLLPLIDAAAKVGVQIFVIDCGWYDDSGDWWPSVGEWMPSTTRFPGPNGLSQVIDAIKKHGMVPGLWLEPEVVGVKSPVVSRLPDSAFFQRSGHRVVEQERYILDLRDCAARAHLDEVIDRLIDDFGIGYFKMDYNVSPGLGTDYRANSVGDGLLGHNRAYNDWIDDIHRRHPSVILENCSSGGMREDFAQTSRFQIQSTSDQQDYRRYPAIAASAPMMVLPEQDANWAYPQPGMTPEQTAFCVNMTMLGRFFLSGYINRMSDEQCAIVKSGVSAYKRYVQPNIARSIPFWPLGLPRWDDKVIAFGLNLRDSILVTIWSREYEGGDLNLPIPMFKGQRVTATTVFPVGKAFDDWRVSWDALNGKGVVSVPPTGGCISRTFEFRVLA